MPNILRKGLNFDFKKIAEQGTQVDPIISFSRSSTATRINPTSGLVETVTANTLRMNGEQELWKAGSKNLIKYGGFDGNFSFVNYFSVYNNGPEGASYDFVAGRNGGLAYRVSWSVPNTSTKGIFLDDENSNIFKADGQWYTWSFWAKATGTVIGETMGPAWNHAPDFTNIILNPVLTEEWQQYVFSFKWNIGSTIDPNGFIYAVGPGYGSLTIDDMQIEVNSTYTDYEQNPIIIQPGLLIEGAATNYCTYSNLNAGWGMGGGITPNGNTTAPDGTNTAQVLTVSITSTTYAYFHYGTDTGTFVYSAWIKSPNITKVLFQAGASYVELTVLNTWKKYYITTTISNYDMYLYLGNINQAGDIHVWGVQLETGTFPTSYIPTAGAAVTRAADNASIDVSKLWSALEGMLVVEADFGPLTGTYQTPITLGALAQIYRQPAGTFAVAGNGISFIALGNVTGRAKLALSVSGASYKASLNGGAVVAGALVAGYEPTTIKVGANAGVGEPLNGTLQRLTYLPFAMDDLTLKASSQLE